jgi:hypothetical protein
VTLLGDADHGDLQLLQDEGLVVEVSTLAAARSSSRSALFGAHVVADDGVVAVFVNRGGDAVDVSELIAGSELAFTLGAGCSAAALVEGDRLEAVYLKNENERRGLVTRTRVRWRGREWVPEIAGDGVATRSLSGHGRWLDVSEPAPRAKEVV